LLAHGRWFSLGTPASSTTKTGRHDIAEILLKVALNKKLNQSCYSFNHIGVVMLLAWSPLYFSLGHHAVDHQHLMIIYCCMCGQE
jgi:uncharacterized protein YdeI (YjbR/CyaY-like superfamily)